MFVSYLNREVKLVIICVKSEFNKEIRLEIYIWEVGVDIDEFILGWRNRVGE